MSDAAELGMNIEEVEHLGRYLRDQAAGDLLAAMRRAERIVARSPWNGPTAERFRNEAWPRHAATLRTVSQALHDFGQVALDNAEQQRGTSASDSSGGATDARAAHDATSEGSFVDRVRSNRPGPQDLDLARLAGDYDKHGVPGWTLLDDDALRARGIDPNLLGHGQTHGFSAALYERSDGTVVLVFHGSSLQDPDDWRNNGAQAVGLPAEQYQRAVDLGQRVHDVFGDRVVITGHSLGGGLASVASLTSRVPAVTFNPAAISDGTLRRAGFDPQVARSEAQGLVHSYTVDGEALSQAQLGGHLVGVETLGTGYRLAGPSVLDRVVGAFDGPPGQLLNPMLGGPAVGFLSDSVELHGMDSVIGSMEQDPRFADAGGGW